MQKVLNGLKALLAVVLSTSLVTGVAFFTACSDGTQDSSAASSSVSSSEESSSTAGSSSETSSSETSSSETSSSETSSSETSSSESSGTESGGEEEQTSLVSGEYIVDISWTGSMQNYLTLILNIDAEEMTFNQYYTYDSTTSKGTGTITCSGDVYTMTYTDINIDGVTTTTFTFDSDSTVITFTSALLWGSSSFDSSTTTEDGSFATYTAQPILASGEYIVDLAWTGGMAAYVTAIVNIDMSTMSFNLYYQSSPDTSKGTGSVIYADGVYTMNYSEAVDGVSATTFTYDYTTKTITFTSALLWGSSSFDSSTTTEDGSFLTYTAVYTETDSDEEETSVYENYTDYINTSSTTHSVSEGVVTYTIVTTANSPAGAFTITVVVGSDKTITSFTVTDNGSTGGYGDNMFDTSILVGKTETELNALLSTTSSDSETIVTGATKSNTLCVYAALFAVGNYDICTGV